MANAMRAHLHSPKARSSKTLFHLERSQPQYRPVSNSLVRFRRYGGVM